LFNCFEKLSEEEHKECVNDELLQNLFIFEQFYNLKNLKGSNESSYMYNKMNNLIRVINCINSIIF